MRNNDSLKQYAQDALNEAHIYRLAGQYGKAEGTLIYALATIAAVGVDAGSQPQWQSEMIAARAQLAEKQAERRLGDQGDGTYRVERITRRPPEPPQSIDPGIKRP